MIKLLILSLHYPPDNIIAARRSEAYAKHFQKYGVFPTIITDRFEKIFDNNGNWVGIKNHPKGTPPYIEEFDTHRVIRIPRVLTKLQKFQLKLHRIPALRKVFTFLMNALGHFEMHLLSHYYNYRSYITKHLNQERYDMILAIDSPHYHIRLAAYINKKFNVPYVCDFRDLYDNNILNENYKPRFLKKTQNFFKKLYFKNWLSKVLFISAISNPYAIYIGKLANKPWYVITNGFEEELFFPEKFSNKVFTIGHFGTLYPDQNIKIFIKGIKLFITNHQPEKILIRFLGLRKYNEEQKDFIVSNIPKEFLELSPRIEREKAIEKMKESHILYYPAWTTTVGVYSGKIFEYLGARQPILLCPGNNDVVEELIKETKAGFIANTPEEVCNFIAQKYDEWLQYGEVKYEGIEEEIMKYSRENQVKKMAAVIHNYNKQYSKE